MAYYITTSRPYTNATPHLGTILDPVYADVYARFNRLLGQQVFFSMGTDEHSSKIADEASKQGVSPQEFVNTKYQEFKQVFDHLELSADNFMQSSDVKHKWLANLAWEKLSAKNLIYKKQYQGLYCKGCEDFYSASQLVEGRCPIHANFEIQHVEEENYFFKLTAFQDSILDYLGRVRVNDPSIINSMKNFCADLQDISISRDVSRQKTQWGVVVNRDPQHSMYVWFEALLTYLSPLVPDELYETWIDSTPDIQKAVELEAWQIISENTPQNLQVIGTDNSKFHLVILPAILFGLDIEPIESIIIHGMINDAGGRKFAKSLGNGVSFDELYNKLGAEGVRFFVLFYCNSTGDTNYDEAKLLEMYNSNLGNKLGNLVMRLTTLISNFNDGDLDIEAAKDAYEDNQVLRLETETIYRELQSLRPEYGLRAWFDEVSKINKYLEDTKPWTLMKDKQANSKEITKILHIAIFGLLTLVEPLSLFLPATSELVDNYLRCDKIVKATPLFERL